jgi:hypothetical protein
MTSRGQGFHHRLVQGRIHASSTKVVWLAGPNPCTLQPLRRKKTVQEIPTGCLIFRDHFAAPLIGLIVFARKTSVDAGPKSKRCSSPLSPIPSPQQKIAALFWAATSLKRKPVLFSKRRTVVRTLNRKVRFNCKEIGDGVALLIGELAVETV